jgi:GxxExxY protein
LGNLFVSFVPFVSFVSKMPSRPFEPLSDRIIGYAIKVHRALGPGLLESAYEQCLAHELARNGIAFGRQVPLQITYEDLRIDCAYRMDLVIERELLVELKSVEHLLPVHEAQMMTYLRFSGCRAGLLLNFNAKTIKDGLKRFVL